jgi:hypothetical protein
MVAGGIHDYIWFGLVFVFFMVVNGSAMENCFSMNRRGSMAITAMEKWLEAFSHSQHGWVVWWSAATAIGDFSVSRLSYFLILPLLTLFNNKNLLLTISPLDNVFCFLHNFV